ncbi:MAG TPA: baseplate J/gp47 family protein, partial [Anseongella sp.]|nr:baseplate J/gp47 family protein [Anseongella sp.]
KQEVSWYYLDPDNDWIPFRKEEIADATRGLIQSGIITFSIPAAAGSKNTCMGEQLHWLKASVTEKTQAVCKLIDVIAQAAVVTFFDHKEEGNYFKQVLPAGTISKLVSGNPAIKKIEQPGASFGGKTREDDTSYYRWVSERLRHKQRAVSMWDYERLVLEQFPEIYKVKCVNHTHITEKPQGSIVTYTDNELKPGHVLIVPVPDLHGKNAFDPLRPCTGLGLLEDIKEYLSDKVSPHVSLDVRNPRFEEIQLEFNVQYRSDDAEFFTARLRQELEQFLAPWAFDAASDIEFGSKVSKSALVNFIEERPYVDYVSCVKMYCIVDGLRSKDLEEAVPGSARSVFVSVKSDDPVYPHIINEKVCTC